MILRGNFLQSELFAQFPVVHGFTLRGAGNLGFGKNSGDPEVIKNREELFRELGVSNRIHVQPKQIHSPESIHAAQFRSGMAADGIYTDTNRHLVSILTADCLPLLAYHSEGVVAAIHAGWRGLFENVIPNTLAKLPANPSVAVGPAIGVCCYEVGEDLAEQFQAKFGNDVVERTKPKPHLNLPLVALRQLQQAGVEDFEVAHLCTYCHSDLFYSFRREGSAGRMMSFIGLL
jgi:purine-nucleoside/S-methyl-5'-thioadenosine phosphorylase / adenosine deaminase